MALLVWWFLSKFWVTVQEVGRVGVVKDRSGSGGRQGRDGWEVDENRVGSGGGWHRAGSEGRWDRNEDRATALYPCLIAVGSWGHL